MGFVPPKFKEEGFNCPFCGAYSHMEWCVLQEREDNWTLYYHACCAKCKERSLWRVTDYAMSAIGQLCADDKYSPFRIDKSAEMIFPDSGVVEFPEDDMPDDVKKDYLEASRIFSRSPRGAAALLRLSLQKLCKHLGEPGENINKDIRSLAEKNMIAPTVIKIADAVRITGNNAVHPGEMSDDDFDYVASKMFSLINFIVKKAISEPKELEEIYNKVPEDARKAAEAADAKRKSTS